MVQKDLPDRCYLQNANILQLIDSFANQSALKYRQI